MLALAVSAAPLLACVWLITQNGRAATRPEAFTSVLAIAAGSLPVLGALWLSAAGYGFALRALLLRGVRPGVIAQTGVGMTVLLLLNWLLAMAGWLNPITVWVLCGIGIVSLLIHLVRGMLHSLCSLPDRCCVRTPFSTLLLVPGLALLVVAACCPPGTLWSVEAFGYDVTSYHLQLPREWIDAGRMAGLEHNVYSYLPSLIEAGYMTIGLMRGSVLDGVYTCQLFHVTLALLAAAAIGKTVAARATPPAGIGAAAVFLAVPWVTVTGSLAYNEMGVLAFGAVAMMIAFDEVGSTHKGAAAVGMLVGAATLAKLTAGVMIALPVGLMLLCRLNRRADTQIKGGRMLGVQLAAVAALAGTLTLAPYLVRNSTWAGNPVFPFATERLGTGHWDGELVERWDTAHGLSPKQEGRLDALGRQWLLNTGYGAIGGQPTPRETANMARFSLEGGVPPLWIVVAIATVLLLNHPGTRRAGGALSLMIAVQVVFWLLATHMQSRFLIPTILPACLIAGLGYDRLRALTQTKAPTVAPLVGCALVATLALTSYTTLLTQTHRSSYDSGTGNLLFDPISSAINTPPPYENHPINRLPKDSKTLLVADNSGLLYLSRPIVYATAFDADPLGEMIRNSKDDPAAVNDSLREAGITHVWVHWSELDRLHNTYGHDRDVTETTLSRLIATGWEPVENAGRSATLYALPAQQ